MTVNYNWANGQIISQSMTLMATITYKDKTEEIPIGPITTKIIYDKSNQAVGFIVNGGITYMFVRNLQGDVIALVDDQGETVLEYSYDPWGKLEYHLANGMDEETAMILTAYCPLTYRGYNYDFSTGLYYLQSRYYNPEWGRLLNTDDPQMVLNTIGDDHGANQFAYCMNNPVNYTDKQGYWGEDVHNGYYAFDFLAKKIGGKKYGTYYWALQSGFSKNNASIISRSCFDIDLKFPAWFPEWMPLVDGKSNQSWHFNVNVGTFRSDSRVELLAFMYLGAGCYFDLANQALARGNKIEATYYVSYGLVYLGYALHPMQDLYAHTDDVVEWDNRFNLWSHLKTPGVDDAKTHKDVIFGELAYITKFVLKNTFDVFFPLLKNIEGVYIDAFAFIM